ncbi:hypothetical protein CB0940_05067 [Cercospora beticola]|uniref:F-box domain-containing protein n=1 Tax=Cercospora beticola TaxID=122368 RepID=A0A2G5HMU0_CERBT|nr:hypothetical protein CB0940_05067 [Cercospora beticola]PIA93818.1 hypothetical protein CB0940_05067 [Cercospora beticola]WPB02366.1 hypothetical protein RHO25_007000 [Cercospora beticola]CAK1362750.1 unnamed protein product [Cercospora beticola]
MTGIASNLQVVENDAQSPLHDLPIELLEWILPYLESEDLFNLRLASTELAAKTVKYMAKTYFTWLHIFMLDSSGISRLIWIAKHPVYKSAVKKIEFNVAVLQDPEEYEHDTWTDPLYLTPEKILKYRKLYADHMDLRAQARHRLKLVLNLFHLAGNVPAISATTYGPLALFMDCGHPSAWGVHYLFREHGDRVVVRGNGIVEQSVYAALCWAIFESAAQIGILNLGGLGHSIDPWLFGYAMLVLPHSAPFTHLRSLTLSLPRQRWLNGLKGADMRENYQTIELNRIALLTLVSQAEKLEYLALTCDLGHDLEGNRECNAIFFRTLAEDQLPKYAKPLQHIIDMELECHEIPKAMLLKFHSESQNNVEIAES